MAVEAFGRSVFPFRYPRPAFRNRVVAFRMGFPRRTWVFARRAVQPEPAPQDNDVSLDPRLRGDDER